MDENARPPNDGSAFGNGGGGGTGGGGVPAEDPDARLARLSLLSEVRLQAG